MDMVDIEKRVTHLFSAIENCMDEKYKLPALILIYSTMDTMAWLNRDETHYDVTRSDFLSWVETFLLPDSGLSCLSIDLYAARCSMLHSYSAESKLSREGKASQIFYAWGNANEKELQRLIDTANTHNAKAIHIDRLYMALKVAVQRFLGATKNAELIKDRADKFFTDILPTHLNDNAV